MNPAVIETMRGFVDRCSRAPIELGPPSNMSEALAMFEAMAKQTKSARLVMLLIESEEATKQ